MAVGSRSSVIRAPSAIAVGPGFDPDWLPWFFFSCLANANGIIGSVVL